MDSPLFPGPIRHRRWNILTILKIAPFADHRAQPIHLLVQRHHLQMRLHIDLIIQIRADAVLFRLTVLTHQQNQAQSIMLSPTRVPSPANVLAPLPNAGP